jgi:hypothetical protein
MSPAMFIDVILTPLAGGLGAWFGFRGFAKRKAAAGESVAVSPVVVGASVAAALFAFKLIPLMQSN